MKTPFQLVKALNKCLVNHDPPHPPILDYNKMNRYLTPEDIKESDRLAETQEITNYRGRFMVVETHELDRGTVVIWLVRDENKDIFAVIVNNQTIFSKEL